MFYQKPNRLLGVLGCVGIVGACFFVWQLTVIGTTLWPKTFRVFGFLGLCIAGMIVWTILWGIYKILLFRNDYPRGADTKEEKPRRRGRPLLVSERELPTATLSKSQVETRSGEETAVLVKEYSLSQRKFQ